MRVVTRRPTELVHIGADVGVIVLAVAGNKIRLGIVAPRSVTILRDKLMPAAIHHKLLRQQGARRFVEQTFAA